MAVVKPDRACAMACGNRVPKVGLKTCAACRAVLASIAEDQREARKPQPSRARVGVAYTRGRALSAHMRRGV